MPWKKGVVVTTIDGQQPPTTTARKGCFKGQKQRQRFVVILMAILFSMTSLCKNTLLLEYPTGASFVLKQYPWVAWKNVPLVTSPQRHGRNNIAVMTTKNNGVVSKQYKWAVIATVNSGFLDFFLNWLSYFDRIPNLDDVPVYIVAQDDEVVPKLEAIPRIHVVTTNLNLTDSLKIGSEGHTKLVSQRPGQILQVWNLTQSRDALLFIDLDAVWLGNPFPDIEESLRGGYYDMATQIDRTKSKNTGFVAFPKTERNYDFLQLWQKEIEGSVQRSQPAYNILIQQHHRKVAILPILKFPWGKLFFGNKNQTTTQKWAKVVHANGVGKGHDIKRKRFQDAGLWNIAPHYQKLLLPAIIT